MKPKDRIPAWPEQPSKTLTEKIMREISEAPGTPSEVAAELEISTRRCINIIWHLQKAGRVVSVGEVREKPRGRKSKIFAPPWHPMYRADQK